MPWYEAFEKDYTWLCNEIKEGKQGKRAFVLTWFNATDSLSDLIQLGKGSGNTPIINEERLRLFPFLNKQDVDIVKAKDIFYDYTTAYEPQVIKIHGCNDKVNCLFLGKESDKFHIALYW